jgi:alkylhydroperoxidase family enzyme
MARIDIPDGDGLEAGRLWALAPVMGQAVHGMSAAVYETSSLPVREREVARMRIAQLNACEI